MFGNTIYRNQVNGVKVVFSCQYPRRSQQQLKYRYHIFMVPGQVNPIIDHSLINLESCLYNSLTPFSALGFQS